MRLYVTGKSRLMNVDDHPSFRTGLFCGNVGLFCGEYRALCGNVGLLHGDIGWLRLVGSSKLQVFFAEYRLFHRALL